MVNIMKSPHHKLKERVKLAFQITQHIRDKPLMQFLIIYFDCGNIYKKIGYLFHSNKIIRY